MKVYIFPKLVPLRSQYNLKINLAQGLNLKFEFKLNLGTEKRKIEKKEKGKYKRKRKNDCWGRGTQFGPSKSPSRGQVPIHRVRAALAGRTHRSVPSRRGVQQNGAPTHGPHLAAPSYPLLSPRSLPRGARTASPTSRATRGAHRESRIDAR
jgi:hypothetical protein